MATAAALLAAGTGGVAGAAPADAAATTPVLSTPDVPAGGTVTHTVKVNASTKGRFELHMEPAEGFRWWDPATEAPGLRRSTPTGGAGVTCREEPYENGEDLAVCDVPAGESTLTYSVSPVAGMEAWGVEVNAGFRPDGGSVASTGQSVFHVLSDDPVEKSYRVFGRDTTGRLYSHRTLTHEWEPLDPWARQDHGSGWNAFDAVTKLSPIATDNRGGGVVAREPSGTLWYYPASGVKWTDRVFEPRVRVGTGWSAYTSVRGTGDVTGDGHPDLVARDGDGVLWLYQGTGDPARPYAARIQVGRSGWDAYTAIIAPGDGSPAGRGALLARDRQGVLYWYRGTGKATSPFEGRTKAADRTQPYGAWM
ncbi:FG-GAP repeat domain-containing protein [Streptomyces roseolilacinus]|uniref:FG-GAP repeat domain-containing protein n=1 Tax=Streptomyces roseolilacinus TaxID=66904 RepID=UPI0037F54559